MYLRLQKAMNGLRSAPLSWYQELSSYLRENEFLPTLDPTIWRRKTSKGLVIVLFYVDDLFDIFRGFQRRKKVLRSSSETLQA